MIAPPLEPEVICNEEGRSSRRVWQPVLRVQILGGWVLIMQRPGLWKLKLYQQKLMDRSTGHPAHHVYTGPQHDSTLIRYNNILEDYACAKRLKWDGNLSLVDPVEFVAPEVEPPQKGQPIVPVGYDGPATHIVAAITDETVEMIKTEAAPQCCIYWQPDERRLMAAKWKSETPLSIFWVLWRKAA